MFPTNLNDGVELALHDAHVSDTLIVSYTLHNAGVYPIWLVNRLFHRRGRVGFVVDPNLVYSAVDAQATLLLKKQWLPVPDDLDVEVPETPYLTPLSAGESFSEQLHLALPIAPHDPYRPQPCAEQPSLAERLVFVLGYVVAELPLAARQVRLASEVQEWQLPHAVLRQLQRLKVSAPIIAAVPTLARYAA